MGVKSQLIHPQKNKNAISETDPGLALRYLKKRFPQVMATQVVLEGDMDLMTRDDIRVCPAHKFLMDLV